MIKGNSYFNHLKRAYIFPIIEQKLADLKKNSPQASVINLGIGDIALPIAPSIAKAISDAVLEMTRPDSIYGYGPSQGYPFLRRAIHQNEYADLSISSEELFISDGINSDIVNILDLFHQSCIVAVPNPSYPAYLDANLIAGRKNRILQMPCKEETRFVPKPPSTACDLIYLCSPHNPTGVAMTREELQAFVNYAEENQAILLYDNAYAAFITSPDTPKSIYEIPGADKVALEFRSFSKSAGFTGLRCSYLVIPKKITIPFGRKRLSLHSLWMKRQSIKFNGVSYPVQKGAEATFSTLGKQETREQVDLYLKQAAFLKNGIQKLGYTCFGGVDAPYIWWKAPNNLSSWEFFDKLLSHCHLITVPGSGFGEHGEGFVRVSAFTTPDIAKKALETIQTL